MPRDASFAGADDDPLQEESQLLFGIRSAISSAQGDLDQFAIDEVLGVTRLVSDGRDTTMEFSDPDVTN